MKKELINPKNGIPDFGLLQEPVSVNFSGSILKTKTGKKLPGFLKSLNLKQFMFTGINSQNFIAAIAIADIGYAAKGFFYIYDIKEKKLHESSSIIFPFFKAVIKRDTDEMHGYYKSKSSKIIFENNRIEADSKNLGISLKLDLKRTEALRLCTKTSYNGWFFTKKQSSIPVSGKFRIKDREIVIHSDLARGLTDRSLGFPGREIWWNWASTSTILKSGREFGLNLSWGVNQTGETENVVWLDKKKIKLNQASFLRNDDATWSIKTNDKALDLKFHPHKTKVEKENFLISATNFTQEIGLFKGYLNTDGEKIPFEFMGWLEDHYVKW